MADMENLDRRVTSLEEWKNNQTVNSALIKQHQDHMDQRIAAHAEHMDKRFDQHAETMKQSVKDMNDSLKKIQGWMSKIALTIISTLIIAVIGWVVRGGLI